MPTKELFLSFNVFFQTFFCPQILCSTLIPAFYSNCFPKSDHTLRLPKCHASPSSSVSLLLDRFMVCCAPGSFGHRERLSSAPSPVPRSSLVSRCPLSPNHVLPPSQTLALGLLCRLSFLHCWPRPPQGLVWSLCAGCVQVCPALSPRVSRAKLFSCQTRTCSSGLVFGAELIIPLLLPS